MTIPSDIDNIKEEIIELEKKYKIGIDNLKRSEQLIKDSENTYNHYLFYTVSISLATVYLSGFLYLRYVKK